MEFNQQEAQKRCELIWSGKAQLVGQNGESRPQPDSLYTFLCMWEQANQSRERIYLLENENQSLGTQEAAAMLGTSLPQIDVLLGGRLMVRLC